MRCITNLARLTEIGKQLAEIESQCLLSGAPPSSVSLLWSSLHCGGNERHVCHNFLDLLDSLIPSFGLIPLVVPTPMPSQLAETIERAISNPDSVEYLTLGPLFSKNDNSQEIDPASLMTYLTSLSQRPTSLLSDLPFEFGSSQVDQHLVKVKENIRNRDNTSAVTCSGTRCQRMSCGGQEAPLRLHDGSYLEVFLFKDTDTMEHDKCNFQTLRCGKYILSRISLPRFNGSSINGTDSTGKMMEYIKVS